MKTLCASDFRRPLPGWDWPAPNQKGYKQTPDGMELFAAEGESETFHAPFVHTRPGDSVEVEFELPERERGRFTFAVTGGFEWIHVTLDLVNDRAILSTSDWT